MKVSLRYIRGYISRSPLLFLCVVGALCFALGLVVSSQSQSFFAQPASSALRLFSKDYPLISPLLLCNTGEQKNLNQDKALSDVITKLIQERVANGGAENMSAYVINYKTGQWAGVNENERYDPASMLKVPLMIAYYHAAEKNPSLLNQKISYDGDDQNIGEYYKSPNDIQAGKFYTVDQLINSMIVNSDNTAAVLLEKNIGQAALTEVYTDLGLPVPSQGANVEYLSAKLYAYFFRVLYNATYLDDFYSEKALSLLAEPDIPGIRQGVPNEVTVANKFGERTVVDASTHTVVDRELHDCGIVYKPGETYLLCIMSRGKDFDLLDKNISDLSALVYGQIH